MPRLKPGGLRLSELSRPKMSTVNNAAIARRGEVVKREMRPAKDWPSGHRASS